jgi:hypothetical protein
MAYSITSSIHIDCLERVVISQSFSNPKLDLPLFKGFFFFTLHQNESKGGWWDFLPSLV